MPVMDEFKEEREALKHGTPKEKFSYFMDYYKWHVVIAVAAIAFIISLVTQMLNQKDTAFYAAMINGTELETAESYRQSFAEYASIDLEKNEILLDTSVRISSDDAGGYSYDPDSMASKEKLMVYIASGEVDAFVTAPDILEQYAYNSFFLDLRTLLTQEQITEYEPYFYYVDQTVIDELKAAQDSLNLDYVPVFPNPADPSSMEEPIPIGIYLKDSSSLRENYYYAGKELVVGVVANSKHSDIASSFIDFLQQ